MGADWGKLALIHCMIGYEANVLGMLAFGEISRISGISETTLACFGVGTEADNGDCEAIQAMLILGFLLHTAGGILMVLTKLGGLGASIIFTILSICAFIISALFQFIGVGLHGSNAKDGTNAYASTLSVSAGILALIASVFLLLALLCKGKGSSTSPS